MRLQGNVATGPGVFDMKAGIVQALHAVAALDDPGGVEMLFTADEEVGSGSSRALLEEPELASRALGAGINVTNMCGVSYSGMKGFSERVRAVTNSAKNRNYSPVRYFPDKMLVDIAVTGKV